jgi:hypothetical protein
VEVVELTEFEQCYSISVSHAEPEWAAMIQDIQSLIQSNVLMRNVAGTVGPFRQFDRLIQLRA